MASVRVRKETRTLYFDFRYRGIRCREQTALSDTPANRRRAAQMMQEIDVQIRLGTFDYAQYFPQSAYLARFGAISPVPAEPATQPQWSAPTTPTFAMFAEEWWNLNVLRWRASTQKLHRGLLEQHLLPAFGERPIAVIRREDILRFRAELARAPGRAAGKTLSNKTINHHMGVLRSIFDEAVEQHGFANPFTKIPALKVQKTHVDPFTLAEVKQVIDSIRADYRDYLTVRFFTGLRTGEADGLRWKYVDFERRQILVRETFSNRRVEYTKTDGSQREVDLSAPVVDALRRQQARTGGDPDAYVFQSGNGSPIDVQNFLKRVWYPLLRYLELRLRRPYQMRHTCATLWLAAGENPEWIARQLGHTTTQMLFQVYSRFVPNLTRKDGSAFDHLIAGFALTTIDSPPSAANDEVPNAAAHGNRHEP